MSKRKKIASAMKKKVKVIKKNIALKKKKSAIKANKKALESSFDLHSTNSKKLEMAIENTFPTRKKGKTIPKSKGKLPSKISNMKKKCPKNLSLHNEVSTESPKEKIAIKRNGQFKLKNKRDFFKIKMKKQNSLENDGKVNLKNKKDSSKMKKVKKGDSIVEKKKIIVKKKLNKREESNNFSDDEIFENDDDDDYDPQLEIDVINFIKDLNIEKFKKVDEISEPSQLNLNSELENLNTADNKKKKKLNPDTSIDRKVNRDKPIHSSICDKILPKENLKSNPNPERKVAIEKLKSNIKTDRKGDKEKLKSNLNLDRRLGMEKLKSNITNRKADKEKSTLCLSTGKKVDICETKKRKLDQSDVDSETKKTKIVCENQNSKKEVSKTKKSVDTKKKIKGCLNDIQNISSKSVTVIEKGDELSSKLNKSKLKNDKFCLLQLKEALNSNGEANTNSLEETLKIKSSLQKMETPPKKIEIDALKNSEKEVENNSSGKLTQNLNMREKLVAQLQSASFRIINEKLYLSNGSEAYDMFKKDPDAFMVYHQGYNAQLSQWPINPLNFIIRWLGKKPRNWVVADFGCGEAILASSVPQKVFSFDLIASSPKIIACDMANTPLQSSTVNVAVFCLSLMGTNITDFILEANRVLVDNGVLKIAEVESRFENLGEFLKLMFKLGFKCIHKNQQQKYFWLFDFIKIKSISKKSTNPEITLKPCYYKKR